MDDETRKLAALAHRIWARWMRAMFAHGEHHDNGTWTMDQHAYRRWTRQMNATYDELHEGERVSDIEVAHEWLEATGVDALRAENARLREALAALVAVCRDQRSMCGPELVDALAAADAALADAEGTTRRSTTPP